MENRKASGGRRLLIALCSEQGFVGGFNSHVLSEVERILAEPGRTMLFLVGDHGLANASERGLEVDWTVPMAAHAGEVPTLANRITENLFSELLKGQLDCVDLVHALPGQGKIQTVTRTLIPFDFARFRQTPGQVPPLLTLEPQDLLNALVEEYVFAEICEAAMLGYAAENEARMYAMFAAHENVGRKHAELALLVRRLRQDEITAEVVELSAGVEAER